jgi:hypothetical protein
MSNPSSVQPLDPTPLAVAQVRAVFGNRRTLAVGAAFGVVVCSWPNAALLAVGEGTTSQPPFTE